MKQYFKGEFKLFCENRSLPKQLAELLCSSIAWWVLLHLSDSSLLKGRKSSQEMYWRNILVEKQVAKLDISFICGQKLLLLNVFSWSVIKRLISRFQKSFSSWILAENFDRVSQLSERTRKCRSLTDYTNLNIHFNKVLEYEITKNTIDSIGKIFFRYFKKISICGFLERRKSKTSYQVHLALAPGWLTLFRSFLLGSLVRSPAKNDSCVKKNFEAQNSFFTFHIRSQKTFVEIFTQSQLFKVFRKQRCNCKCYSMPNNPRDNSFAPRTFNFRNNVDFS